MSGGTYTGKGGEDEPMQIDDETLMALADGELDPLRAGELRQQIAADPELQARLFRFEETRRLLAGLRKDQEGPDPLAAMIRAAAAPSVANGTAEEAARWQPANLNRRPWLAAAASAAVVAIGLGWWQWADTPAAGQFSPGEIAALERLPSGQAQSLGDAGELTMIASFRAADGTLCREYETSHQDRLRMVLACRDAGGWAARFVALSEDAGQAYHPASGEGSIDEAIAATGAQAPLSPDEEAAALAE